jgi:hypothetical protein
VQTLREVQLGFAAAVLDAGCAEDFAPCVHARGLAGERRIQVYRNNLMASLCGALSDVHPVLRRLVGEDCFAQLAREYVRNVPSTSGDIHRYGHAFADFVAGLADLAPYPYLADVARLEWAYHEVFHSEIASGLELEALRTVAVADYPRLRFCLQPAARLLASPWPVLRMWQVNQPGWNGDQTVGLDAGGVHLLVMREAAGVALQSLSAGEYRLLESLARGTDLAEAYVRAAQGDPGFDLGAALRRQVAQAVLVEFIWHAAP